MKELIIRIKNFFLWAHLRRSLKKGVCQYVEIADCDSLDITGDMTIEVDFQPSKPIIKIKSK